MGQLTDLIGIDAPLSDLQGMLEVAKRKAYEYAVVAASCQLEGLRNAAAHQAQYARRYQRVAEVLTDLISVREGAFCEECGALYDLHAGWCSRITARFCGECGAALHQGEDHHERCVRGQK